MTQSGGGGGAEITFFSITLKNFQKSGEGGAEAPPAPPPPRALHRKSSFHGKCSTLFGKIFGDLRKLLRACFNLASNNYIQQSSWILNRNSKMQNFVNK